MFKVRYTAVGSSCNNNECHVSRITCALSYHNNLKLLPGSHCNKCNRAYLMLFLIIGIDGKHQFCYGVGNIMLLQIMFTNKAQLKKCLPAAQHLYSHLQTIPYLCLSTQVKKVGPAVISCFCAHIITSSERLKSKIKSVQSNILIRFYFHLSISSLAE